MNENFTSILGTINAISSMEYYYKKNLSIPGFKTEFPDFKDKCSLRYGISEQE